MTDPKEVERLMAAWMQGYEAGVHDTEHPTLQPAFNPYEDKASKPAPEAGCDCVNCRPHTT